MKSLRALVIGLAVVATMAMTQSASALTTLDLVNGNTGTANVTIYNYYDGEASLGAVVPDPFLRLGTGASAVEEGYNNSVGTPWQTQSGAQTHDFQLKDVRAVSIGGLPYFEFLLDIKQETGAPLLTLNNVRIFTRSTAITVADEDLSTLGTLRYNSDVGAAGDVTVELDASRNSATSYGDMLLYVPTSLFAGASQNDYVYFYARFGDPNAANGGYEEWANLVIPSSDTTAPSITITTPTDGASYLLNQSVLADYACEDETGGSGLDSCVGTVADDSEIDTATVGAKSFTVNADDIAGNPSSQTNDYHVTYLFSDFLQPVDNGILNAAKAGKAIALKWRVTDARGVPVTSLTSVSVTVSSLACSLGTTADEVEEYATGNSGLQNLGDGYYQFNWKTPTSYANSCKTLSLSLGEGVVHTAQFKFSR